MVSEASDSGISVPNTAEADLPPMLREYREYKSQHPECIIFFQVGDFYEVFFEDAVFVSRTLNLTLTSRDKSNPNPVPMCGVPVSSVDGYLSRLVAQGCCVAVVSQLNSFSNTRLPTLFREGAGSGKLIIQRKLTRIVTPAIRVQSGAETVAERSFLASAVFESERECALASTDVQSGRITVREGLSPGAMIAELERIMPAEVVLPRGLDGRKLDRRNAMVRRLEHVVGPGRFRFRGSGELRLVNAANGSSGRDIAALPGYVALGVPGKKAVQLLVAYVDETIVQGRLALHEIQLAGDDDQMVIDASARDNLELVRNSRDGSSVGTLFGLLNACSSAGGERILRELILAPLLDPGKIRERQDGLQALLGAEDMRRQCRSLLHEIADLERIAVRLELFIATPRELAELKHVLQILPLLREQIKRVNPLALLLQAQSDALRVPDELQQLLSSVLADNPPLSINDGGIIRQGHDPELDRLRSLQVNGKRWMEELEQQERQATGISSLKIKFNYVLGYFIEITRANSARVPKHYLRRQSTANYERYTTEDLRQREGEVLGAQDRAVELERRLFDELLRQTAGWSEQIRSLGRSLSELDVVCALAEVADREGYVKPEVNESRDLEVEAGQHPVLAKILEGRFVPNSLSLRESEAHCAVITGPNMGGKSTYLRQAGLIVIMAQIGSFVPARYAKLGIVDKIFARIGASDNISEGESTFMVEMREAARIVNAATSHSLVLIDEIGRGTATTDGLAIAQAVLEWIVSEVKCRSLFATHFHELTAVANELPQAFNLSVGSVEDGEDVIFTHEICSGPASKSYGIEVARLAGLPAVLLGRARELLSELESGGDGRRAENSPESRTAQTQLPLFRQEQSPQLPPDYRRLKGLASSLGEIDVLSTTPLQALNILQELKQEFALNRDAGFPHAGVSRLGGKETQGKPEK